MKYLLLFSSMILAIGGQLCIKHGLSSIKLIPEIRSIISAFFSPFVITGFLLYGVSSIIWLFVLQRFQLSVAYPAMSVSYILIILLSVIFLKEPFTMYKIIGAFIILTGVYILFSGS